MPRYTKTEIAESLAKLREWIKPGDTVYTVVRRVSRSGMSRDISVIVRQDGTMLHPNHAVSRVLGMSLVRSCGSDAVRIGGCGMDMGFAIVHDLSYQLHGTTVAALERVNHERKRARKEPLRPGYTIRHEWL